MTHDEEYNGRGRGRAAFIGGPCTCRGRQTYNKAIIECYKCHKLGYYQYECPTLGKQVNYVELDESEKMLLMAYVESHGVTCDDVWFLDSVCSNHMCGDRSFYELDEEFR